MADESTANTVVPASRTRPSAVGDVPEHLKRRYYTDGRGGDGLGFYADAKIQTAAFHDHGRKLATTLTNPNVIHDLAAIAQHRGWSTIVAHGQKDFRREAWIAGRSLGLDVRGYQPTERDLQELEKRIARRDRSAEVGEHGAPVRPDDRDARANLKVAEAVIRARVKDSTTQDRILDAAHARISGWLQRGARFEPLRIQERLTQVEPDGRQERQRSR